MVSINKTKKLWNKDREFKTLRYDVGVMCCWYWCWIYGTDW